MSQSEGELESMFAQARSAMAAINTYSLNELNHVIRAIAWSVYNDANATELARIAVRDTKLGNVPDKVIKNKRKTLGTLNDLLKVDTIGPIVDKEFEGVIQYLKPLGVIVSLTPSTNPAATLINQAMMAIKARNAIIFCPSPAGYNTAKLLEEYVHLALEKCNAPKYLFQVVDKPINFTKAENVMSLADLCIVTGDQQNVKRGYKSGIPCIGVGKGNVPVIIDSTADVKNAAEMITKSKIFDNSTSCSSENAVVILDNVYDSFIREMKNNGGYLCNDDEAKRVQEVLFCNGKLNREAVCKDISELVKLVGLNSIDENHKYLIIEESGVGSEFPSSGEKMSLVLTAYKVSDINTALSKVNDILSYEGEGHSIGIHSNDESNVQFIASNVNVARVIVNQAHTFANGGGAENSLPFTLTMGCGSWAGNSNCENLSINNFLNTTRQVNRIKTQRLNKDAFGEFYDASLDV